MNPSVAYAQKATLSQLNSQLSKLSGQGSSNRCNQKTSCHPFLKKMEADDFASDRGLFTYAENCKSNWPDEKSFTTPFELGLAMQKANVATLGPGNFLPSYCYQDFDMVEAGKKYVSKFYYSMARLAQGELAAVSQMYASMRLLGEPDMSLEDCSQYSFPEAVKVCQRYKNHCKKISPEERTQRFAEMETKTAEILKKKSVLRPRIQDLSAKLLNRLQPSESIKKLWQAELKKLQDQEIELDSQAPWIRGEIFQTKLRRSPMREAISLQLADNVKNLRELNVRFERGAECLKGFGKECEVGDVRRILNSAPELHLSNPAQGITPENRFKAAVEVSKGQTLNSYHRYQMCIQDAKISQIQAADIVSPTALIKEVVQLAATSVLPEVGWVVGAESVLLRTLLKAGGRALGTENTWQNFRYTQQACQDQSGLREQTTSSNDSEACSSAEQIGISSEVKSYSSCMEQASQMFLAGGVLALGELKSILGVNKFESTVSFVERHNAKVAQRAGDYVGKERRSFRARSFSGYDGKIMERNPKIENFPNEGPGAVPIVKVRSLDGVETFHFEDPVQLPNGQWRTRWTEFKVDPVTGGINANFPGGVALLERKVQSMPGAQFIFVDYNNLGAVNKFKNELEDGDRFIKAVAKIIQEKGKGKVTIARLGGDEICLIFDEPDPQKAKDFMDMVIHEMRWKDPKARDISKAPEMSEPRKIFYNQKKILVEKARTDPTPENLNAVREFAKVQMPSLSVGIASIKKGVSLGQLRVDAELAAMPGKIDGKLNNDGQSAIKYGDYRSPKVPNPLRPKEVPLVGIAEPRSEIEALTAVPPSWALQNMKFDKVREVVRFSNQTLSEYKDEMGVSSYRLESHMLDFESGRRVLVSHELPTRGSGGLLDGAHPQSQELAVAHFNNAQQIQRVLVYGKLRSLRYLNYFSSGMVDGDRMLNLVSELFKKEFKRDSDLKFQMGGADFLMAADHLSVEQVQTIEKRMSKAIAESPEAKDIIAREKQSLDHRLLEVKAKIGKTSKKSVEAEDLERELKALQERRDGIDHFDFRFEMHSLRPEDLAPEEARDFASLRRRLEGQFSP